MANTAISKINVEDNGTTAQYLIEPTLYTTTSGSGSTLTAALTNFELFIGVAINVKFSADVPANAQLNVNATGAKDITYAGTNIKANVLLQDHIYTLVYKDTWQVVNEVSSGMYLPLIGGTLTGPLALTGAASNNANKTGKGINWFNGENPQGHIGFEPNNTATSATMAFYTTGQMLFRASSTYNSGFTATTGMKLNGSALMPTGNMDLGTSSAKWNNVYATTFNGTATRATADASGNEITSTYAKLASPAFTGTPTAPTAADNTNDTQIATTAFVMNTFKTNDAMLYKGVVNTNSDLPATHSQGWTYKVGTAGEYAGIQCEVGDMIICNTDGTAANNAHWNVIQTNIDGAVIGPASSTANAIARFDETTGKIIKNSGATLDDDGNITANGLTINGSATSFNFSTIGTSPSTNVARPIWFSYAESASNIVTGTPATQSTFAYNPSTYTLSLGSASSAKAGYLASNYTLYLRSGGNGSKTSIIFQQSTLPTNTPVEIARFDTNGNFIPGTTDTNDIGNSSKKWANIYATNFKGNADSASEISASLAQTTKTYLLGTSEILAATAKNVSLIGDSNVYLTASEGELSAASYSWNVNGVEKAHTEYDATNDCINFIFD